MLSPPNKKNSSPWKTFITLASLICIGAAAGLNTAQAQTLKLRFPFDDAGPGTTTASDTSGGGLAVTLNMETQTAGTAVDLPGAARSGVQGQGRVPNQLTNSLPGTVARPVALCEK